MRKVFITTFTIAMTTALLMGTVGEASEETKNKETENPGMTDTASIGGSNEDFEVPERGLIFHVSKEMQEKGVEVEPCNETLSGYKDARISFYYHPETDQLYDKMLSLDPDGQKAYQDEFDKEMSIHRKCLMEVCLLTDQEYQEAQSKGVKLDDITGFPNSEFLDTQGGYSYILSIPKQSSEGMSEDEKQQYEECIAYMDEVKKDIRFSEVRLESDETNVGDGMPAFTTTDLDGNEVTNDIFAKKDLTVLNVWGTFCGPCIEEMPELGAWAKELPENVQLIGFVSDIADLNDEDAVYMAKTIAEEANADFPQLIGGGEDFSDFMSGIIGVPTTFFIDRNGNFIGEPIVGAYVEQYKENVKNYLAEMGK